jgi:hypothetical protein
LDLLALFSEGDALAGQAIAQEQGLPCIVMVSPAPICSSHYEGPASRATLKQVRLATRLGVDLDCPVKPKWMRWRTYDHALDRLDA